MRTSRLDALFFFQAEDGIRDLIVTGVQTCALPISFWIEVDGPKIRGIGVGKQGDFGREFEAAVAAHSHTVRRAFEKFFVSGLAPAAGVGGGEGGGGEEGGSRWGAGAYKKKKDSSEG